MSAGLKNRRRSDYPAPVCACPAQGTPASRPDSTANALAPCPGEGRRSSRFKPGETKRAGCHPVAPKRGGQTEARRENVRVGRGDLDLGSIHIGQWRTVNCGAKFRPQTAGGAGRGVAAPAGTLIAPGGDP